MLGEGDLLTNKMSCACRLTSQAEANTEAENCTVPWAMRTALRLVGHKVLRTPEHKKMFMQTLVLLITGRASEHTEVRPVNGGMEASSL